MCGGSGRSTVELSGRCPGAGREAPPEEVQSAMNDIHQSLARNGLVRPRDGRVLGGVCAGLGQRFGLTPWTARLLFVLVLMLLPGSQILIYPVLWILMPSEDASVVPTASPGP